VAVGLRSWLLLAIALLVPLVCSPGFADAYDLPKLVVIELGLGIALLAPLLAGQVDVSTLKSPASIATLAFLGVNAAATLLSRWPGIAAWSTYGGWHGLNVLLLEVGWFLVAASWVRTESALARLACAGAVAATIAALYGIAQAAGFDPVAWPALINDTRPARSTLGYANSLAEYITLSLPLTVWLVTRLSGIRRDLLLWSIPIQLAGIAVSQTRTAQLVVVIDILLGGLLVACAGFRGLRVLGLPLAIAPTAVGLVVFGAVLVAPTGAASTIPAARLPLEVCARLGCAGFRGAPLDTRAAIWQSAAAMVRDRPVLGWGPGALQLVYPAYRSVDFDALFGSVVRNDTAHNILLETGVDSGALGLGVAAIVYTLVFTVLIRGAYGRHESPSRRRAALALVLTWSGYLILFLVGRMRLATDWYAWVCAGAAVGLFARRARTSWRLGRAGKAVLGGAALVSLVDGGFWLIADTAAQAANRVSTNEGLPLRQLATNLRPFAPKYRQDLGTALQGIAFSSGDIATYKQAVDQLQVASALVGNRDPDLLSELADVTLAAAAADGSSTERALAYADQAIAVDPLSPLPYADAAEIALRAHQVDLASDRWEAARVRTRTPDALRRLGGVAAELGDMASARIAYREAAKREWRPVYIVDGYRAGGDAAMAAGAPDEAVDAYRQLARWRPDDVEAELELADALIASGQRDEALVEVRRVLARAPDDVQAQAMLEGLTRS
jgi:putative inorganic carbon (HCO3(-)) transporter